MFFYPELCRNKSEVESKFIVHYLLPKLGYSPDIWHQEVAVGIIRLEFIAFATPVIPFVLDGNLPMSVILEAKHPNQNLNNHVRRLRRYLVSLNIRYGLLTNGKQIKIFESVKEDIQLVFQCSGKEIEARIDEIRTLIGRDSLKEILPEEPSEVQKPQTTTLTPQYNPSFETQSQHPVKTIAVYHNKGGVGKTTTVVNLAAALRKKGKRVLVIDLDSQANTTYATGLIKFDREEVDDIKNCNILQVLQSEEFSLIPEVVRQSQFNNPEIDVVPAHINLMQYENELGQIDYSNMSLIKKLKAVEHQYDVVLIDTPPSLNLYAKIALITSDYLIIPSDLKPFANQGLLNVNNLIKQVNIYRKFISKQPLQILGVVPCKIPTHGKFLQYTLPRHIEAIPKRYGLNVMDTVIYQREELSKCIEPSQVVGNMQIPDPRSVFDYKPDGDSAKEFELLAIEVMQKIGMES